MRIGLGSFAFRYAVGFAGFVPKEPMDAFAFLHEASRLGFHGIQLCENLRYSDMKDGELSSLRTQAEKLGMFIEVGMNSMSVESLGRHLDIAGTLSSGFLRVVLGGGSPLPEKDVDEFKRSAVETLKIVLPRCRQQGVKIGIENHFDLPSKHLLEIVHTVGDENIGLILDTTNGIGFTEAPEETMNIFNGHILSVHLKDYKIRKIEAGYMMTGAVLGEGTLRIDKILKEVLENNPLDSVIMEMTVRRGENHLVEDVIAWERDAVEKSAKKLFEIV